MKISLLNVGIVALCLAGFGRAQDDVIHVIPVWPGVPRGSENWTQKEVEYSNVNRERMVRNVVTPTLTVFPPSRVNSSRTAVIVCPGGAFRFQSWQSEGTDVAQWLAERGVAAFVLKYRLVKTPAGDAEFRKAVANVFKPGRANGAGATDLEGIVMRDKAARDVRKLAAADVRQAVKLVRRQAAHWGIAPERIGLIGFSSGAMLALDVAMDHDAESRPNFVAAVYGGTSNGGKIAATAPPLFIAVADDDALAAGSSTKLYFDWKAAGHPVELHVYAHGGHGFGMSKRGVSADYWIDHFGVWLAGEGLVHPPGVR